MRRHQAEGHGYLASPRARNVYAFEETNWDSPTAKDPQAEDCPQCLAGGGLCGTVGDHNYNEPRNALGGLMETHIQATYSQGQDVVVDVVLTAHHMVSGNDFT